MSDEPSPVPDAAPAHHGVSDEPSRFLVDLPGYHGTLEHLVTLAQRGEIDLAEIPVAEITGRYRDGLVHAETPTDPREVADFLALASRLVSLKAARLLPTGSLEASLEGDVDDTTPVDDAGARLAEYRLFKAAAEALLAEAAEQGVRSFLGLVAPEVVPAERLAIPPERLAAAFRAVLQRIPEVEPFQVETVTFSVDEKASALRDLLRDRRRVPFEEMFAGVRSRLEAVACFLALLELVKSGEARVDQEDAFGDITVSAVA